MRRIHIKPGLFFTFPGVVVETPFINRDGKLLSPKLCRVACSQTWKILRLHDINAAGEDAGNRNSCLFDCVSWPDGYVTIIFCFDAVMASEAAQKFYRFRKKP